MIDEIAVLAETLADKGTPPAHLGVTHWSTRLMAQRLGISFASVARIWRKWGIQPHRVETFKFSTDPQLEAKLRDVVGLYLDPRAGLYLLRRGQHDRARTVEIRPRRATTTSRRRAAPRCPCRRQPGGGVHGVCGHSAARAALRSVGLTGWPRRRPNRAVLSLTLR